MVETSAQRRGAWTSDRRATLPADWPARRRAVLDRDGHRCVLCGAPANQVDHIGDRLNHALANLRALCAPCHAARTARQGAAAAAARRRASDLRHARRPEPHPGLVERSTTMSSTEEPPSPADLPTGDEDEDYGDLPDDDEGATGLGGPTDADTPGA